MIVVTEVKTVETDRDRFFEICHWDNESKLVALIPSMQDLEKIVVTREMIEGREFHNRFGEKIVIGLSKQVQEALGIPMEAFEDMQKNIDNLEMKNMNLQKENYSLIKKNRKI